MASGCLPQRLFEIGEERGLARQYAVQHTDSAFTRPARSTSDSSLRFPGQRIMNERALIQEIVVPVERDGIFVNIEFEGNETITAYAGLRSRSSALFIVVAPEPSSWHRHSMSAR